MAPKEKLSSKKDRKGDAYWFEAAPLYKSTERGSIRIGRVYGIGFDKRSAPIEKNGIIIKIQKVYSAMELPPKAQDIRSQLSIPLSQSEKLRG
ncbi:hypothetical protein VC83_09364 [Pseudogymnoascus destructans]|uniref:Uncharacterized protein n=1 Tax=Pseudogymnoascus destructans TaxID=655981 RepID=A0A176ZWT6_9PEZI|nr:uncharacterized protein VC83_09364 [Pseudogymnoascus destructans]OAF54328.1 hypothetical protein VC83_09364 [Pseudogymnoascus destructans]